MFGGKSAVFYFPVILSKIIWSRPNPLKLRKKEKLVHKNVFVKFYDSNIDLIANCLRIVFYTHRERCEKRWKGA